MKYLVTFLLLLNAVIWLAIFSLPDDNFHVIACDVGQGDAILITYKTTQILIDGGPDNSVLTCLARHVPFWDKEIEMVMLTHPQTDHFTGLINVFKSYKVDNFVGNQVDASTESYQVLKKEVGGSGTHIINPYAGQKFSLGLISLDILNPSYSRGFQYSGSPKDGVLGTFSTKDDLNFFSVTAQWTFQNFCAITTGDISGQGIDELISQGVPSCPYLKVPHHGSKNGLTQNLLDLINPQIAAISVGRHNRYGHPSPEVIDMLSKKNIKILRTDQMGDVEVVSNGNTWWVK